MAERLFRSRDDRMLAGVAAGVAERFDADPSLIRIAWALLTIFTGGIALVVYVVMAIVVPEAPAGQATAPPSAPATDQAGASTTASGEREARRAARRDRRRGSGDHGRGGLITGVFLIAIGGFFLIREFIPWFNWHLWWPVGLIALGVLLLVLALLPGRSSD